MSILNIRSSSPFIQVNQQYGSYVSNNGPSAGTVRFNPTNQHLEAYDGSTWINISPDITVELNYGAIDTLHWAMKKMTEEKRIKELAEQHPMVADAVATLKDASERLEVALALTEKG